MKNLDTVLVAEQAVGHPATLHPHAVIACSGFVVLREISELVVQPMYIFCKKRLPVIELDLG